LAKKRKYNRGKHYQEFWLFGGVERVTGRWFGRVVYDKRTKDTLLPIIKQFIKPRTKIMSDMFATYVCERGNKLHTLETNRMLLNMEYTHSWVNHSLNFVDPITGTHTNTIEGLWETRIKRHIKSMRGMTKKRLDDKLNGCVYNGVDYGAQHNGHTVSEYSLSSITTPRRSESSTASFIAIYVVSMFLSQLDLEFVTYEIAENAAYSCRDASIPVTTEYNLESEATKLLHLADIVAQIIYGSSVEQKKHDRREAYRSLLMNRRVAFARWTTLAVYYVYDSPAVLYLWTVYSRVTQMLQ
ncbi:hypothetical protein L916_15810, partial [Phytophthora nicotianae]